MAHQKTKAFFAIACSTLMAIAQHAFAVCPDGYQPNSGIAPCKVRLSQYGSLATGESEFGYEAANDPGKEWPVCGANRLAVGSDLNPTEASSSGFPNAIDNSNSYKYVASTSTDPVYGFGIGSRCVCLSDSSNSRSVAYVPNSGRTQVGNLSSVTASGFTRFHASTYEEISSTGNPYGPVAISSLSSGDPRAYTAFSPVSGASTSVCGCPNINEHAVRIDGSDNLSGSVCNPLVSSVAQPFYPDPAGTQAQFFTSPRVLTKFSSFYQTNLNSHKLATWSDGITGPAGSVITSLRLPKSRDDLVNLEVYERKIWTCAAPYELNTLSGECVYEPTHHACDSGGGVTDRISPYAESFPTASQAGFDQLVNKKLACCLNSHFLDEDGNVVGKLTKFDCVENRSYQSFNELWSMTDDQVDGNQMNALMLVNGHSQPITGFYSLNGTRCNQYSEFAGAIQPQRVDSAFISGQQSRAGLSGVVPLGPPLPVPQGSAFQAVQAQVLSKGKTLPSDMNAYRNCPILVRAAMVVRCPDFVQPPRAFAQITDGATGLKRCPVASSILINVRIEQVYEIAGQPSMKPFDTFVSSSQASGLDVSEIINTKFGMSCPPGTYRGDAGVCIY